MSKEIEPVLDILDEAIKKVPSYLAEWDENPAGFELHILEIEYGDEKPLGERLGVDKSVLPAAGELEEDEIDLLVEKIQDLWEAYHYLAEFPEGMPVRKAYEALLSVWDEPVMACTTGRFHFDFYGFEDGKYFQYDEADDVPL